MNKRYECVGCLLTEPKTPCILIVPDDAIYEPNKCPYPHDSSGEVNWKINLKSERKENEETN
jgi:hypothetical protein